MNIRIRRWPELHVPTEVEIRRQFQAEELEPYRWSNGPGDVYDVHTHNYHKVLYVAQGSITFNLPDEDRKVTLRTGDRLDLPAGTVHEAVVGLEGVVCLEAHRP